MACHGWEVGAYDPNDSSQVERETNSWKRRAFFITVSEYVQKPFSKNNKTKTVHF